MSTNQALPSWGELEQRLEGQRRAIFRAQAVVSLVSRALLDRGSAADNSISEDDAVNMCNALELADQALSAITGELEPVTLLECSEEPQGTPPSDELAPRREKS